MTDSRFSRGFLFTFTFHRYSEETFFTIPCQSSRYLPDRHPISLGHPNLMILIRWGLTKATSICWAFKEPSKLVVLWKAWWMCHGESSYFESRGVALLKDSLLKPLGLQLVYHMAGASISGHSDMKVTLLRWISWKFPLPPMIFELQRWNSAPKMWPKPQWHVSNCWKLRGLLS